MLCRTKFKTFERLVYGTIWKVIKGTTQQKVGTRTIRRTSHKEDETNKTVRKSNVHFFKENIQKAFCLETLDEKEIPMKRDEKYVTRIIMSVMIFYRVRLLFTLNLLPIHEIDLCKSTTLNEFN